MSTEVVTDTNEDEGDKDDEDDDNDDNDDDDDDDSDEEDLLRRIADASGLRAPPVTASCASPSLPRDAVRCV